jgi:hypothetical protein
MALPTFFIIGAAKAGTTSMHHYLDQHPEIQMSAIKETHFFSGPENGFPYTMGRVSELDDYERLFDPAAPMRGESSPSYTGYPRRRGVPERIGALLPHARFIYLVRDPVERAVSHHRHRVAVEGERRSLAEAFGDLCDPYAALIGPSLYAMQLDRYLNRFPQEQILIVDQADMRANRKAALARIFDFLCVDRNFYCEQYDDELYRTEGRRVYPPGYASFIARRVVPCVRWLPASVRLSLRRAGEQALLPPLQVEPLEDSLRERLQQHFAGDAQRLRELTGQAFSTWSV